MKKILSILFLVLMVFTDMAWAARDCSANPNCSLFSGILEIVFWGALILSAINIIIKEPIRGTVKVLSYIFPFLLGLGLPMYVFINFNVDGWLAGVTWIGSWFLAYQYINLHVKIFPEDKSE